MVFSRPDGVGHLDLTPQNSSLFLRVKSDARLVRTRKSLFLDGHKLYFFSDQRVFKCFTDTLFFDGQPDFPMYLIADGIGQSDD